VAGRLVPWRTREANPILDLRRVRHGLLAVRWGRLDANLLLLVAATSEGLQS
jgi:hypothetical protein